MNKPTFTPTVIFLADLYLDWINNFCTVQGFAGYHELPIDSAGPLIQAAKECHDHRAEMIKTFEEEIIT